ncbi:aspartate aminotransferase family protein [Kaustia mangrovi]|uniref:Aspartate aminotransferase family protein n=1 Tax=Kaustia mangrovi TaxID=2593653 RepID=A0A7S8C5U6_9HYPH|nr:aspartate aminotransferase family protein [Kaustia mangrovi]
MTRQPNRTRMFHRDLRKSYPEAQEGQGAYILDTTGKQYLDASGGAAVSCLGHGHPKILEAVKAQLDRMAFAHTAFFTNSPAETLAETLSRKAPGGDWRVYFLSGGSEANETALKLARQIQRERGQDTRDHFLSRRFSYHGNTLGALSVSGSVGRRAAFEPILLPKVRHVEPCFAYRHQGEDETAKAYGERAAASLQTEVGALGDERAIAFIAETVVGATLGAVPPVPGYFKEIRRICDEHGMLMILDEVMSGMGRTGTLFACEQDGVVPDMISLAKGLGAGYQPIGAVLVREELADEIEHGSGSFLSGHTYIGHATACAGALAVQQVFEEDGLVARVADMGEKLQQALEARFADHPHIGDIRGRGLFRGVELVAAREHKTPFPATAGLAGRIKTHAMENGLICYPSQGTADGVNGDHVLIAPPFIITDDQVGELTDKLARSVDAAITEVEPVRS